KNPLNNFWGQRDNLHKLSCTKLTGYWSKDPSTDGLVLSIDQNCRVRIEANIGSITSVHFFLCSNNNRFENLTFFYFSVWDRILNRHNDHITNTGIFTSSSAQHFDAHDGFGTRIISHV